MSILSHECMEDIENSLISHGYHHTIAAAIADAVLRHDSFEAEVRRLRAENARAREYLSATVSDMTKVKDVMQAEAPGGLFVETIASLGDTISALKRASHGLDITDEYQAEITRVWNKATKARELALEEAAAWHDHQAERAKARRVLAEEGLERDMELWDQKIHQHSANHLRSLKAEEPAA